VKLLLCMPLKAGQTGGTGLLTFENLELDTGELPSFELSYFTSRKNAPDTYLTCERPVFTYANTHRKTPLAFSFIYLGKGKAIPLQAWSGPEGSRRLKLPDLKTIGT